MDMRLLGPVEAYAHGRQVHLGPRKQRFVLAILALEVNQVVPVDRLVELMWPQSPPRTAVHAVRVCASRLRSVLAGAGAGPNGATAIELAGSGGGYVLHADPMTIDAHRFRALAEQARTAGSDEERVAMLDRALGLWVGPALAGSGPAELCERLCRGLQEARLVGMEDRMAARLRLGHHRHIVEELTNLVTAHPARERLVGQLMMALYRAGQPADALRAYREARQRLADELGLDPGAALRQMELAILRGDPSLDIDQGALGRAVGPGPDVAAARATQAPARIPALLPPAVAGFTGRDAHRRRLDAVLARHGSAGSAVPIAVITGTAGVGKTALAIHWAYHVSHQFPDGQLYVDLRGYGPGTPMAAPDAIRSVLDALDVAAARVPASQQARVDLYRSLLASRRMLVVLDNAATVDQVRPLLPGAPGCLVLVTSRDQLTGLVAVEGAHAVTLDVLAAAEARQMLAHRLGAGRIAAEPLAIDELITMSAGLPLALAIIAARAAIRPDFPLGALVDDIRASRGLDPFDVGDPSADVRALFSWSYRTLSGGAARLFRLLGLHAGPDIALAAAASLAGLSTGRTARLVTELARAHLITERVPGRYAFHDLLRAYAVELAHRVDSEPDRHAAQRRALDHYLHTAHAAARLLDAYREEIVLIGLRTAVTPERLDGHAQAFAWLNAEYAVLLAAIEQATTAGFDAHTWQLACTLKGYFERRGRWHDWSATHHAAHTAAQRLGDPYALALSHHGLGRADEWLGRYDEAHVNFQSALELFTGLGDRLGQARTCHSLGRIAELQGRHADALRLTQRGLELFRSAGDRPGLAKALNGVGWYHTLLGDHREALACCTEALSILQELGDRRVEANTWDSLGYAHHQLGDHRQAIACYGEALARLRCIGDRFHEADVSIHLGDAYQAAGDRMAARETWHHALAILDEIDHPDAAQARLRLTS